MKKVFGSRSLAFLVVAAILSPANTFAYKAGEAAPENATLAALEEAYADSAAFLSDSYNEAFPRIAHTVGISDQELLQGAAGSLQSLMGAGSIAGGVNRIRHANFMRDTRQNMHAEEAARLAHPELLDARSLVERLSPQDRAAMVALYEGHFLLDPEYRAARGLPALSEEQRARLLAELNEAEGAAYRQRIVLASHERRVELLTADFDESRQRELERILAGSNLNPQERAAFQRLARQRRGGLFSIAMGLALMTDGGLRLSATFLGREPGISPAYNFGAAVVKAAAEGIWGSGEAAPAAAGARGN